MKSYEQNLCYDWYLLCLIWSSCNKTISFGTIKVFWFWF